MCVIYIHRNVIYIYIYITWSHWDRNSRPFQKFQHHRDITAFISRRPSVPPPWDLSPTVFIPIWFILLFSLQNNRSYLTPYSLPLMRYGIDACIWNGWDSQAEGVENAFLNDRLYFFFFFFGSPSNFASITSPFWFCRYKVLLKGKRDKNVIKKKKKKK